MFATMIRVRSSLVEGKTERIAFVEVAGAPGVVVGGDGVDGGILVRPGDGVLS